MHPGRLELTMVLADKLTVTARPNLTVVAPILATDAELSLVHDPDDVAFVRVASTGSTASTC